MADTVGAARGAQTALTKAGRRLIVALDFNRVSTAHKLASELASSVGMFKIGSQLFTAEGPAAVEKLAKLGLAIFLDLKFHDIPNTVSQAVAAAAQLPRVRLMTIHALGGAEMMMAASRAVAGLRNAPRLLGVTVLTSLSAAEMRHVGIAGQPRLRALKLAQLAKKAGLHGVVASAQEAGQIRRACGKEFVIVVPGVRPTAGDAAVENYGGAAGRNADDQARVATPGQAIRAGADYIVVGRPITVARNPVEVARTIVEEIDEASHAVRDRYPLPI